MSMEWNNNLATGIADIDNQHREIFSRVAKLTDACSDGRGKEEVLRLLLFLQDYIKEHSAPRKGSNCATATRTTRPTRRSTPVSSRMSGAWNRPSARTGPPCRW